MNLTSVILFVSGLLLVAGNTVFAEPYLMLDADSDSVLYVGGEEESIVTTDPVFTLYALVNSESPEAPDPFVSEMYYISVALVPDPGEGDPGPVLGSYFIDGVEKDVVGDMIYGTPPIEDYLKQNDLPSHGIFETYYHEYSFVVFEPNTATLYNSQDTPGGPTPNPLGTLYYEDFEIDISGLAHGYALHFDLYTKNPLSLEIDKFAPFSHDVLATPVPASVILGILGLGVVGMKLRKFA